MTKFYSNIVKLYAESLYSIAKSNAKFSIISEEVDRLYTLFLGQDDLVKLMSSPIFKAKDQLKFIDAIVENYKISGNMKNFLRIMALNGRLSKMFEVLEVFILLRKKDLGLKMVEVVLSSELTDLELKKLSKILEEKLNSKIELKVKIEESVLGGIIVKVDNLMFDASLRSKFNNLSQIVENRIAAL